MIPKSANRFSEKIMLQPNISSTIRKSLPRTSSRGGSRFSEQIMLKQKEDLKAGSPDWAPVKFAKIGTHPACRLAIVRRAFHRAGPLEPNPLAQPGLHPLPLYSAGCNDGLNARSSARSYNCSA